MKRFVIYLVAVNALLHGITCLFWYRSEQSDMKTYGTVLFVASVGLATIALAFFSGPTGDARSASHSGRLVTAADFDNDDRRSAISLGGFLAIIAVANAVLGLWLAGALS